MKLDYLEPAIDMLAERTVLITVLKIRAQDHLNMNSALQMLCPSEAVKYLLDNDKGFKSISDASAFVDSLLNEHLDAFIPTNIMWAQLTK